jgi:CBS domain-containing protein
MSAFAVVAPNESMSGRRVSDVMTDGLVSCERDGSLKVVAELMSNHREHCVVVTDDPGDARSLWGVISDLDLVAAASVRELDTQIAGATAMTPAVTIAPAESLQRAADLMTRYGVAHLVVVDPAVSRPVGVISTLDLAGALAD